MLRRRFLYVRVLSLIEEKAFKYILKMCNDVKVSARAKKSEDQPLILKVLKVLLSFKWDLSGQHSLSVQWLLHKRL